jgi:hypothetical protein
VAICCATEVLRSCRVGAALCNRSTAELPGWCRAVEAIETQGVDSFLEQIWKELNQRNYVPLPARRQEIPKDGGKVRVLSIPAIRDPAVQGALKLILERLTSLQARLTPRLTPLCARLTPRQTPLPPAGLRSGSRSGLRSGGRARCLGLSSGHR